MPRITTKGQVTIPKEIRETLGIEPGDEIAFEEVSSGYKIQKKEPTTADGNDPLLNTAAVPKATRPCPNACVDFVGSTPRRRRRLRR